MVDLFRLDSIIARRFRQSYTAFNKHGTVVIFIGGAYGTEGMFCDFNKVALFETRLAAWPRLGSDRLLVPQRS